MGLWFTLDLIGTFDAKARPVASPELVFARDNVDLCGWTEDLAWIEFDVSFSSRIHSIVVHSVKTFWR